MKRLVFAVLGCLCFGLVSACGGGGGGGTTTSGSSASTQQTKAVLQVSSVGSAGVKLSGVGITIHLPSGVTPKTDSNGVVSTVVTPSGVAVGSSMTPPQYTPAQSGTPGTLSFVLASNSAAGFGPGEFVTVNLDIAPGSSVKASDFTLSDFKPIDLNYANINGMSASFAADIN